MRELRLKLDDWIPAGKSKGPTTYEQFKDAVHEIAKERANHPSRRVSSSLAAGTKRRKQIGILTQAIALAFYKARKQLLRT